MAQTPTEMKALLARHGMRLDQRLGQHFLADPNIVAKIVATAEIVETSQVIEVGAGSGALTSAIARTGPARLLAYEVDRSLAPVLAETVPAAVDLRFEDITRVELNEILDGGPWMMVANLPYNVGTPLVLDVLRHVEAVTRLVVMIQREVADRFVAKPGTRIYGLPSVVVDLHAHARLAFRVPPQVFVPPPNVESAVVVIDRKPASISAEAALGLAAAAFGQRRKMLRRSLADAIPDVVRVLRAANIEPTLRPEQLAGADFIRLAEAIGG